MRLTTQPFQWTLETPFPNTAQLYLDEVQTDTVEWALLNIAYVPDSAYQYVAIGNFFEDSLSTPVVLDSNGELNAAYVFVDEVCVSLDPIHCGIQTVMTELNDFRPLVFPNPVDEALHVVLPSSSTAMTISIDDIAGRMIGQYQIPLSTRERTLDVSSLPEGVYVLHVTDGANSFAPVRFVHVAH